MCSKAANNTGLLGLSKALSISTHFFQEFGVRPLGLLLLLVLSCQSCSKKAEVARVRSPDGTLDAIVVEIDGGGTVSYRYDLRIVSRGQTPAAGVSVGSLYGALRNEDAYGVNPKWQDSGVLFFEYWKAKTATLDNPMVQLSGRAVKCVLKGDVLDTSAPRGNMAMYPEIH